MFEECKGSSQVSVADLGFEMGVPIGWANIFWKYKCAEAHFGALLRIFSQLLGRLVSKTRVLPHAAFPLLALANTGCKN